MSTNNTADDEALCWICLDTGRDSLRGPPRHACSCRGETGAVHVSCLLEYAKRETEYVNAHPRVCPICKQEYNLDFQTALTCAFLAEALEPSEIRTEAPIRLITAEANWRHQAQSRQIMVVESSRRRRAMVGALFAIAAVAGYVAGRASRK